MVLHQIFSTFHYEFSAMRKFLSTATSLALRFSTPMQPYVLIYPPKPYSIDFRPQNSHMLPPPPLKLTNGAWISSLKSPYPILEIWADYIMQNLSIPPPEFHLWTHAYAATNIALPDHQSFLLFITEPDSKSMYMQSPGFVFPSLHFHHKFLAI